ncbi:MAG TPA: hypothetical protein VH518_03795, partial [Tepidisphaeraceae bacterium]
DLDGDGDLDVNSFNAVHPGSDALRGTSIRVASVDFNVASVGSATAMNLITFRWSNGDSVWLESGQLTTGTPLILWDSMVEVRGTTTPEPATSLAAAAAALSFVSLRRRRD